LYEYPKTFISSTNKFETSDTRRSYVSHIERGIGNMTLDMNDKEISKGDYLLGALTGRVFQVITPADEYCKTICLTDNTRILMWAPTLVLLLLKRKLCFTY
jgi:hypothetical protein